MKLFSTIKKTDLIYFTLFLFICGFLFHWLELLSLKPVGTHVWRQTDSLSIVQNYYYDHQPFFLPRNSDYRPIFKDITLTEFPIFYYITALIWNFTGESFAVLRALHLSAFILGLWGIYRICILYIPDKRIRFIVMGLTVSSPILMQYAPHFLPNVPAIGFSFYAWYLLVRYKQEQQKKLFVQAVFWLTMACLLKITLIYNLIIIVCLAIYDFVKTKNKKKLLLHVGLVFLSVILIYSWLQYLKAYNGESAAENLFQSFSVFTNDWNTLKEVWNEGLYYNWIVLEHRLFWIGFCLFFIFNLVSVLRNKDWVLFWIHLLMAGSTLIYFLLFFISFNNHDYYLLDFIPLITLHLITTAYYLSKAQKLKIIAPIGIVFTCLSIWICSGYVTARNFDITQGLKKRQSALMDYHSWEFDQYFRYDSQGKWFLQDYRKQLYELGLNRKTPVICMPDQSPNMSLCYYNLRGMSNFHLGWDFDYLNQTVQSKANEGYKYFIHAKKIDLRLDSIVNAQFSTPLWQDDRLAVYKLNVNK